MTWVFFDDILKNFIQV